MTVRGRVMESVEKLMRELEFYKGKRVLMTGYTGFRGAQLCWILALAGAEVTGYFLNPPTRPSTSYAIGLEDMVEYVIGDVRDLGRLMQVFRRVQPEIVSHLATQPIVRGFHKDSVYTYETNVMETVNVLECIRQNPCVKSSVNVTMDKVHENREQEYGYRECDPLNGHDPYSNSKPCSELTIHSYQKSFFQDGRCVISTPHAGNVVGGGDFANDRIIPDCIRAATAHERVMVRSPYSTRPYQYVLEPLAVYLKIARVQHMDIPKAGYYNVGPDDCDCITTGDLAIMFYDAWGGGLIWVNVSDGGPHEANFLKLDYSKVKKTFGWTPRYHVSEAILKTVEWPRAYLDREDMVELTDRQIREFFS